MSFEPDALLSVAQAAAVLGVHANTVRSWTDNGRLAAYRINARGDRRVRRSDVMRLLVEDAGTAEASGDAVSHAGELAIFGRIATGLAAVPTVASVARTLVEALRADLNASRAAVYLASDDLLRLAAHAGFAEPPPATRSVTSAGRRQADAELVLETPRGLAGLLLVDAATAERISPALRQSLVATAATALAGARLLGRGRRDLNRARTLTAVAKELAGELDLGRVMDDVVERTRTLFGADRAGLWLFDEASGHPIPFVTRGLSESFLARTAALTTDSPAIGMRAIVERRPMWARDAHLDPAIGEMREAYAEAGIRTACLVPLLNRGEPVGVIGLYHDRDRTWPDDEVALAQAFGDQAAIAIQNARLYRSVADQAARIRSIQDLSARLNRLTDVRAIAEAIVAEARTLAGYHDIRIYRVDWERRVCDPIAFTRAMLEGDPADAEDLLRVAVGEGFTGWVAEHAEPLLINDALDDPRGQTIEGTDDVPESMLVVPMLYEGQAVGVIVLSQLGFNRFTTDDLQTVSIFAGYAAQAMANAARHEQLVAQSTELARRADSQRRLLEINERLLGTLDQAGVLETIADGLRDVVAYDNLSIYRVDESRRAMVPVLARERHAEEVRNYLIPFGRGLMGWAVEHAQPILANDALNDPRALQIPGTPPDPEAVVVVPLIADGEVLGALNVSRVGGEEIFFSDSDFELVQLFAAQASIALRNADTHHAMSQRAETDALTGLGNHGAFQRDLGQLIDEYAADDRRLALLMMDLDSFKRYNDAHGHPSGDALLHRVATAIYGAARSDDRVYRYGGDEFALILPGASVPDAARVAERVRAVVAPLTSSDPTPVTITVGVAGFPADATDRAALIAVADMALYYGKRSGEDRVVRSDRLPRDVRDLRGTLEGLAEAALREGDDDRAVEQLVERAARLAAEAEAPRGSVRDALLAISRSFDTRGPAYPAHGDRVSRLALTVAEELGMSSDERADIELAALLHALNDEALAELASIPSLREVSALIAGYRALVADSTRRPRRASRPKGRRGAHVVALANAYDLLVTGLAGRRLGRHDALDQLRADPATYRSDALDALARVVNARPDAGKRRRGSDAPSEEDRGAA